MENKIYTLGIKMYTDGDFSINNAESIGLEEYVDYETYFMVKSWDSFEDAKANLVNILNFIKENIQTTRTSLRENIIKNIDEYMRTLDITIKQDLFEKYARVVLNYESNQEIRVEFTAHELSYDMRMFAIYDRLQEFKNAMDTSSNIVVSAQLSNLLQGRRYNDFISTKEKDE